LKSTGKQFQQRNKIAESGQKPTSCLIKVNTNTRRGYVDVFRRDIFSLEISASAKTRTMEVLIARINELRFMLLSGQIRAHCRDGYCKGTLDRLGICKI
jgi:hypothetical protein